MEIPSDYRVLHWDPHATRYLPGILNTCKQIRLEALQLFLETTVFTFTHEDVFLSWLTALDAKLRHFVHHVCLASMDSFEDPWLQQRALHMKLKTDVVPTGLSLKHECEGLGIGMFDFGVFLWSGRQSRVIWLDDVASDGVYVR